MSRRTKSCIPNLPMGKLVQQHCIAIMKYRHFHPLIDPRA